MARVAAPKAVKTGGLYAAIARAVEINFAKWEKLPKPRHYLTGELLPDPYPYIRVLEAARAGTPVNIGTSDLPPSFRRSVRRSALGGRAIVSPDDSVIFPDDGDGRRLWLEESGLLYGCQGGHGPEKLKVEDVSMTDNGGGEYAHL